MAKKIKLTTEDREFFRLVSDAAFINPFSKERLELNRRIACITAKVQDEALRDAAISKVIDRVGEMEREGKADLLLYEGSDKELVRSALLFDVYHRYNDDFDKLILEQSDAGDKPCAVPFAKESLALLKRRGFPWEEARQYFAFFYQLRRAFFFIHHSLVGQSSCIENLRCRLWENIFTNNIHWYEQFLWNRMEDFSTFLLGETGTGKGTAAAAIGRSGFIPFDEKRGSFTESFTRNFISINLSQFPESLIESELFGHTKGAFTGAVDDHDGVFGRCTPHGAIFLDEIGDVSVPVQIKLLQVLQDRTFSVVGGHQKLRFRGRVIAATNKPLDDLRKDGAFREDFFYRLCSDVITVPPLRQQIEEDPKALDVLLAHAVKRIIGESSPDLCKTINGILAKELCPKYPWSGNVRELEQAVRRILLTRHYQGDTRKIPSDPISLLMQSIDHESFNAPGLLSAYCNLLYQRHGTFEEVARITHLDRRTVKKYIQAAQENRTKV